MSKTNKLSVAYFNLEFALNDQLPIFAGGLGILAGDLLLQAAKQRKDLIGVGLFYHQSYSNQLLNEKNQLIQKNFTIDPQKANLELILDKKGKPLLVKVSLGNRQVKVKAWKKMIGSLFLILLDTNVKGNSPQDINICKRLYASSQEHRLQQMIILGFGGILMLKALGIKLQFYHLNEGHSAFIPLAVMLQEKKICLNKLFFELQQKVKKKTVFTNHTILPSGNEIFNNDLISLYLLPFAQDFGLSLTKLLQLGNINGTSLFSMPEFAMRLSHKISAVSQSQARINQNRWREFKLIPITNGICLSRWLHPQLAKIWPLDKEKPGNIWLAHQKAKQQLLDFVFKKTKVKFNPEILTLGWARRITKYKQPETIISNLKKLEKILNQEQRPVQVLMAGKAHLADEYGKEAIEKIIKVCQKKEFKNRFQFIPNYNIKLARLMVSGCDVWVNTPLKDFEACGTSGMKAALNGVLQLTVKDGWCNEVDWQNLGWVLDAQETGESFYQLVMNKISPLYYQKSRQKWINLMIKSGCLIRKNYSIRRMLNEYYQKLYV